VAGASFQKVPADESLASALASALGDPNQDVRAKVASSLSEVLFESSTVAPALLKALQDETKRKGTLEKLDSFLDTTPTPADLRRVRLATLSALIPAMKEAMAVNDEQIKLIVYRVLGRIVAFSRFSGDEKVRKAVEPALSLYLAGLDESDPAIREEVLGHVGSVPIRRRDIGLSLNKFLERPDCGDQEKEQARLALKELASPASTDGVSTGGPRRPPRAR
jgi:hypothetical protein